MRVQTTELIDLLELEEITTLDSLAIKNLSELMDAKIKDIEEWEADSQLYFLIQRIALYEEELGRLSFNSKKLAKEDTPLDIIEKAASIEPKLLLYFKQKLALKAKMILKKELLELLKMIESYRNLIVLPTFGSC